MDTALFNPVIIKDSNLPWLRVAHLGSRVIFPQGAVVGGNVYEGCKGFYLILKGMVRLSYPAANGQEKVLFYVGRNSLFNDMPALIGTQTCIFTCLERVEAIRFETAEMRHPSFAAKYPELISNWLESAGVKCSLLFAQLSSSGVYSTFANVCRLLYTMSIHNRENGKIVPYLTQQDLASMLGIHRGSLHKAFTRLREEGIIGNYSRKELVIHDLARLRVYVEDND